VLSRCSRPEKGCVLPRSALHARGPFRLSALLALVVGAVITLMLSAPNVAEGTSAADDVARVGEGTLQASSAASSRPLPSLADADARGDDEAAAPAGLAGADVEVDADPEVARATEEDVPAERPAAFAEVDGLVLHLPTFTPVVHGFHEASWRGALALTPLGDHQVLPSRGRRTPPTSAVDVVMLPDDRVLSPVSGTVEDVERFSLYGRYRDRKVTIVPDDAPHLRVVAIHVARVLVAPGDRVEAGTTELAKRARPFPFRSQIDKLTAPDRWGHVHLEVKHAED
jgi:hypothetical protein